MQPCTRVVAVAAFIALGIQAASAAPPQPLTEGDLRAQVVLFSPAIAPDGKHVVLVVRRADFAKNTYRNELILVDTRSGATRILVGERDDASDPTWSPSGDRLAYVATPPKEPDAKDEPAPQLYVLRMDGGDPARVTDARKGVEGFAWRPDGRAFAYISRDVAPDEKRIKGHDDWFEITDNAWTSRSSPAPAHLWTIAPGEKKAHRVTHGTWSLEGTPSFAPHLSFVVVIRTPRASANHYRARSIAGVALSSGFTRDLPGVGRGADDAHVSPDGQRMVFTAKEPHAFSQSNLFEMSDLSHVRNLSAKLDRNVRFGAFLPGDRVAVTANDGTRGRLFTIARNGTWSALPLADVDPSGSPSAARDGTLAFIGSTPAHPSELYVLRANANAPQRLTHYNDRVAAHPLGRTRTIVWRSADGFDADGVLTEPVHAVRGRRYPLVVLIHGGPTATSRESFNPLAQLMAARGWYVFQPNYRGSDNLGHRWAQATVPHITSAPAQDVLDGVDAVLKLGGIDTTRIGVSGWSEGGLLTSWLIGHDHRWRAAMSGAAVNDWTGYADMTDAKDFSPSFIGRSPWTGPRERALYDAESPLTYAADVKTPTLIMTDAGDQRVPTPLSYEFYHAVRATGTPVEMVVFPVNGHFPSDPLHREEVNHRWIDWFARHF